MSKYYLNAYLNDQLIGTLKEGQIIDIDDYIVKNKINSVGGLYNQIKGKLTDKLVDANLEFRIEYKYNDELKTVPILYNQELSYYRSCPSKEKFIYKKMCENNDFKKMFEYNFINKLVEAPPKSKIYLKVRDYFNNFSEQTFISLYNSIVSEKNNKKIEPQDFDKFSEYEEAIDTRRYNYKEQRRTFFFAYFFGKDLPKTSMLVSKLSKEKENEMLNDYNMDEFEEQMNFDINPDDGYRLYGKRVDFGETDEETPDESNCRKL